MVLEIFYIKVKNCSICSLSFIYSYERWCDFLGFVGLLCRLPFPSTLSSTNSIETSIYVMTLEFLHG